MNIEPSKEPRDRDSDLRRRAEEALDGKPVDLAGLQTNDIQYLLHELQVHQAELAIQNEELRHAQQDLEVSRDLYSDLYNFAPSGYCTLSLKGRILNANQTMADLLGIDQEKLLHRLFSDFVEGDSQDDFYLHIKRAFADRKRTEGQLRLVKSNGELIFTRIESVTAPGNPGQLMVMLDDITDQRQLEMKQEENTAQMMLQRRLIEQSERERVELARNLHDGPIQGLASLGFSIQIIKEIMKEHGMDDDSDVQQMGDDIKSLIGELRNICNDLRPPVLSKLGLRRAIAENVEELSTRYPQTRINLELSIDPARIKDTTALALYRIYQQAMNNINRHAKASEVWVRLNLEPGQILFEVEDNGQGISGKVDWSEFARQGHLGLVGMKERAEALGGTLKLFTPDGGGTLVQVTIPTAG